MAQKVQITLVDDIDGGPATETVSFSLDGVAYEIDLSDTNASRLREAFAPYVGTARRLGGRSGGSGGAGGRRSRPRGGNNRIAEIRAWARENGHKVNERGRIPADITAAFEKAHG
jgi:nucleoid-associated protein Lsr2